MLTDPDSHRIMLCVYVNSQIISGVISNLISTIISPRISLHKFPEISTEILVIIKISFVYENH